MGGPPRGPLLLLLDQPGAPSSRHSKFASASNPTSSTSSLTTLQPADREAALAALQVHMRTLALDQQGAPHSIGGPLTQGPPAQRGPQSAPSMELRFVAFRRPLASQQDTDFFVGLLHAAEKSNEAAAGERERGPSVEDCDSLQEIITQAESPSAENLNKQLRSPKSQRKKQGQSKAAAAAAKAAAAAAAAAGVEEGQQTSSVFLGESLPRNFVAIDVLGLKVGIAKDEKKSNALLERLRMAKELSDSKEKLQNHVIKNLREKLHTEIALMQVIANDEKEARF
ncbi:hypothetical protein Emed_001730 [Eimeria media]